MSWRPAWLPRHKHVWRAQEVDPDKFSIFFHNYISQVSGNPSFTFTVQVSGNPSFIFTVQVLVWFPLLLSKLYINSQHKVSEVINTYFKTIIEHSENFLYISVSVIHHSPNTIPCQELALLMLAGENLFVDNARDKSCLFFWQQGYRLPVCWW